MDKNDLKAEIRRLLNERGAVVVAIDGNSASGKTTLAEELREEFSARVFHCDDYFLQPYQRTEQRLNGTRKAAHGRGMPQIFLQDRRTVRCIYGKIYLADSHRRQL